MKKKVGVLRCYCCNCEIGTMVVLRTSEPYTSLMYICKVQQKYGVYAIKVIAVKKTIKVVAVKETNLT